MHTACFDTNTAPSIYMPPHKDVHAPKAMARSCSGTQSKWERSVTEVANNENAKSKKGPKKKQKLWNHSHCNHLVRCN